MSTTLPTVSDRAQRLMALAEELKVTDQQRRFCEFLAGDPEQNQTRAAEATGSGKSAHVVASKWLKIAKVKAYLAAVREVLGFTRQAGAETEGRIASAQEVLQTMSAHLRGDVDDFLDEYGSFDLQKARAAKKTRLLREMVGEEERTYLRSFAFRICARWWWRSACSGALARMGRRSWSARPSLRWLIRRRPPTSWRGTIGYILTRISRPAAAA